MGDTATCTITNDDIAPVLTVTKTVINDNGGTLVVADFPLFVDGGAVTSGATNTYLAGVHTVSETGDPGYAGTIGGDCAADGTITLAVGDTATCTITNDDIAPVLNDDGDEGDNGVGDDGDEGDNDDGDEGDHDGGGEDGNGDDST